MHVPLINVLEPWVSIPCTTRAQDQRNSHSFLRLDYGQPDASGFEHIMRSKHP